MKIVVVVTYTYPYVGSGIGNVARVQAELLAKRGHSVTIISANEPRSEAFFGHNGVNYLKLGALTFLESLGLPVPLFWFDAQARKAIAAADIVHAHGALYPTTLLAFFWARYYGVRKVLTQHVPFVRYPNSLLNFVQRIVMGTMARSVFSMADRIGYLNKTVAQWLTPYSEKLVHVPNGVDLELFHPASDAEKNTLRITYGIPTDRPVVLFVGRLVPKKGYDIAISAASDAYTLLMAGAGEVPPDAVKNTNSMFTGAVGQAELAAYYQLSDLLILPSYGEGFPLCVQEALASGLPVVMSQEEIQQDTFGGVITYVERNAEALAEGIRATLALLAKDEHLPQRARAVAAQQFNWDTTIDTLEEVYSTVLYE